jgi:predicted tellurium resistance membrane protein TerC
MKQQHTVTTLPPSPDAERRARMIKYTIAMSIRVLCIVLMLFVQGWWLVVCAAGAIFLPYIAVVLANVGGGEQGIVERPGAIVPIAGTGRADASPEDVRVDGAGTAEAEKPEQPSDDQPSDSVPPEGER